MKYNDYKTWITKFMESWKNLDYKSTLDLLDRKVKYYENPIDAPCKDFGEIEKLWEVVEDNQKNIDYTFKIILCDEKKCIVNWKMTRTMTASNITQNIDGIFQISLTKDLKCSYFKQWRFTR